MTDPKYFDMAWNEANEAYNSADGYGADPFFSAIGPAHMGEGSLNAAGEGGGPAATRSQPIIVEVKNTGTADISDVALFDAFNQLGESQPAFGNPSGIELANVFASTSYSALLQELLVKTHVIGSTYVDSDNSSQITETVTAELRSQLQGSSSTQPLIPTVDPYQQQSNKLTMDTPFRLDGYTKLIINRVLAGSTTKYHFYPSKDINISRALAGGSAESKKSSPKIVRGGAPGAPS